MNAVQPARASTLAPNTYAIDDNMKYNNRRYGRTERDRHARANKYSSHVTPTRYGTYGHQMAGRKRKHGTAAA